MFAAVVAFLLGLCFFLGAKMRRRCFNARGVLHGFWRGCLLMFIVGKGQ